MVITVALYIILGIIALFVIIFSVRVRVTIDMADDMRLWVTVLGIRVNILPKKPKKYKIGNYTLEKIAKRDAKKAAKEKKKAEAAALKKKKKEESKKAKKEADEKLTGEEKAAKRASSPPLPDLISLLLQVLGFFFPGIFSKFHFHVARIKLRIGGSDAAQIALTYYAVSNALGPVLNFIDKHSNLHGMRRAEIEIIPDFLSEEIKADVKLGFSTSLGGILGTLLKAGFKLLFGYMKIKPKAESKPKDSSTDQNKTEEKPQIAAKAEQKA